MTGAEIIALISVGATAFGTLITTCFTSMSLSRCKKSDFLKAITDDERDKFAHTFVSKANLQS